MLPSDRDDVVPALDLPPEGGRPTPVGAGLRVTTAPLRMGDRIVQGPLRLELRPSVRLDDTVVAILDRDGTTVQLLPMTLDDLVSTAPDVALLARAEHLAQQMTARYAEATRAVLGAAPAAPSVPRPARSWWRALGPDLLVMLVLFAAVASLGQLPWTPAPGLPRVADVRPSPDGLTALTLGPGGLAVLEFPAPIARVDLSDQEAFGVERGDGPTRLVVKARQGRAAAMIVVLGDATRRVVPLRLSSSATGAPVRRFRFVPGAGVPQPAAARMPLDGWSDVPLAPERR